MRGVFSFLCLLCLLPGVADAASLERLRAFVHDTQTARASFIQTVTDKNGRLKQQASGEFAISRPGKFRWSVDKPYQQLLVGDGERVWIYDPDLNQVVKRRNDQALGSTPAALLAGKDDVERAFDWHDLPSADGLDWLGATPKDKESSFSEIRLGFKGSTLAALEIFDNFGQRTLIRLTHLERNPKLAPDLFQFTPPEGADVVGD
ncbi:MAG TPA: outer membrane lipoprotein chaperone LolA [Casimicrobiaceae bacterium]|nr:outer membrane lipoprotein chaperone LolA [Casimicrobiaceae bacterium]